VKCLSSAKQGDRGLKLARIGETYGFLGVLSALIIGRDISRNSVSSAEL
jgi:hypothetical protein